MCPLLKKCYESIRTENQSFCTIRFFRVYYLIFWKSLFELKLSVVWYPRWLYWNQRDINSYSIDLTHCDCVQGHNRRIYMVPPLYLPPKSKSSHLCLFTTLPPKSMSSNLWLFTTHKLMNYENIFFFILNRFYLMFRANL